MLRSAVPSLAASAAPRSQRLSSCPASLRCCMVAPAKRTLRESPPTAPSQPGHERCFHGHAADPSDGRAPKERQSQPMDYGESSMTNANGTNTGTSSPAAHPAPQIAPASEESGIGPGAWIGLIVIAAVIAAVVVYGILKRSAAERALANENTEMAIPDVAITHPTASGSSDELALPGNTQAFVDT